MEQNDLEIFLVATPGLEAPLAQEAAALGWTPEQQPGGVTIRGGWPDAWRANLWLRGATRVLVRIGGFRAMHLAQLDKRARKFPWADILPRDLPIKVETVCRASKIYHAGAATQRIERAISETMNMPVGGEGAIVVKARIEDDLVTFSIDSTGESLHKRGHKEAVAKAPMRETMAAMFLSQMGFDGSQPVLDPMCGSGTFVIEAAEIASRLAPGRSRGFAFQRLANFDADAWAAMAPPEALKAPQQFFGSDRDAGAICMSQANAERAGVAGTARFRSCSIADLQRPDCAPGIVIVNPPYGARIGNKGPLFGLHAAMGEVFRERLQGWRIGIVTSEGGLAKATGLPFQPPGPIVAHGGLKIRLWQTGPI
ncbi:class I SAM-dependent RNA methyltransferase [Paracoccus sp. 1_MG-2023]|uniref:THUMP domain-containing class I SAM-dependent RNA methyltransferase n=1 Tax=unclassified Paracoccus (in: a-proteobacteria) TaxID=2688777 RepID=UPI001C09A8C2|nr:MULTISPECIES: class I SAM-dependent RNA methyltransferase [unclassified Paracoccus (in: a-proteobacteria)]MBU2956459.1 class I SAM-dependent RNA methyltransferase [Paracoccus sp. C2R09]MDO6669737.1 class I SAM-dependent RNA methyltransferase [Paracoccus sp. 1_MG-2023]